MDKDEKGRKKRWKGWRRERRRGAGEEMERERANRNTGVWVINAPLRLC